LLQRKEKRAAAQQGGSCTAKAKRGATAHAAPRPAFLKPHSARVASVSQARTSERHAGTLPRISLAANIAALILASIVAPQL